MAGWLRVQDWDWPTIALVLGIKMLLLTFAMGAVASASTVHPGWLEIWNRWDATHYLDLAKNGYVAVGESRVSLVFFPLYPWLVRAMAFLSRVSVKSGEIFNRSKLSEDLQKLTDLYKDGL